MANQTSTGFKAVLEKTLVKALLGVSAITKLQCNITFKFIEYLPIYNDLPNSYQNLCFPLQLQIKVKL